MSLQGDTILQLTYFGFKIRFICGADAFVMLSTTPNSNVGCTAMMAKCLQYISAFAAGCAPLSANFCTVPIKVHPLLLKE